MSRKDRNYGIVVIGYNRLHSLNRLLRILNQVDYKGDRVTLIISLDFNEDTGCRDLASEFQWDYGNKIVRFNSYRLGLRSHVIQCGNYLNEYDLDAIAVFEDDIVPSGAFYNYMRQVIPFYEDTEEVAGISLYSFRMNYNTRLKFEPAQNGFDTYFAQSACSWGQIWTRRQWNDFYEWYKQNDKAVFEPANLPKNVCEWRETSWLKYYIKYCAENGKFYVYPYNSLSTNFNGAGTHVPQMNYMYQVPIMDVAHFKYRFAPFDEDVKYDVFFERMGLGKYLQINDNQLCVDLYGTQTNFRGKRFWLSSVQADYKILKRYASCMYPKEENIIYDIEGEEFYLYDTYEEADNNWNNQDTDPYLNRGMDWVLECQYKGAKHLEQKHLGMFRLVNQWLQKIQEGKDIIRYFEKNDVHTIAIYGLGEIGRTLAVFLRRSSIVIRYGIDRNAAIINEYDFPIIIGGETMEDVDLIVVTVLYEYDKIKTELEKKTKCKVVSLTQILDNL